MGRRRGFFAELQRQNRIYERERAREVRDEERARKAAIREMEKARKNSEAIRKKLEKASAADQKRLEKEAKLAHVARMEGEVLALNSALSATYSEIDCVLAATLEVDDFVDLALLKEQVLNVPFPHQQLYEPTPPPKEIVDPPRPRSEMPEKPTGLSRLFGGAKYRNAVQSAQYEFRRQMRDWEDVANENEYRRRMDEDEYIQIENLRIQELETRQNEHELECEENGKRVENLINGLAYGTPEAVQEYIGIVLSNSVYPEELEVEHEFEFDVSTAELILRVFVCAPDKLPSVKSYKYTKSTDEITAVSLSQKACKDRYSSVVNQVALRSLHEIFEADRRNLIKTISLEVGAETIIPATGLQDFILFVATGAERDEFTSYNLSAVDPLATLTHMGASVSKNPFGLVSTSSKGVRR